VNRDNRANALGVSPDGSKVFVTGSSGTIAYNASTVAQLWVRNYASGGIALGVSPDGSRVFVTGSGTLLSDYTTVAYDASAGGQLWVKRYKGPGNDYAYPRAVEVSRDGSKVFVTGGSPGVKSGSYAYATLAYNASTGARLWVKRYGVSYSGGALALGTSPDGSKVFVTGVSGTIAYNASTGAQLWVRNFINYPVAFALGVSPDGSKVFVTGGGPNPGGVGSIYTTIAYSVT
jgi:WD40 repeat protein